MFTLSNIFHNKLSLVDIDLQNYLSSRTKVKLTPKVRFDITE